MGKNASSRSYSLGRAKEKKKKGLLIDPINKHSAKVNVNRKYLYKCFGLSGSSG